jgi:hypothetical protein
MSTNVSRSTDPADAAAPATTAPSKSMLSPHLQSSLGVSVWGDFAGSGADIVDVSADLASRGAAVHSGDLRPIEAALLGQAETLATMFTNLHLMAKKSTDLERMRVLLTLALKAQAQSRATLETLVETRRPRQLLITRQANVAQNQVVNNDGAVGLGGSHQVSPARTEKNGNAPIELLEEGPHAHSLDTRAARTSVGADPHPAALEAVDRAPDARRQSRRVAKRLQGWPAGPDA